MGIKMAGAYRFKGNGNYRIRLAVPAHLRDAAQALLGKRSELIANLGTTDKTAAERLAPAALKGLRDQLEAVRAHHEGRRTELTDRDAAALAGEFYRDLVTQAEETPGDRQVWLDELEALRDQVGGVDGDWNETYAVSLSKRDKADAAGLLTSRGFPADPAAVQRLGLAVFDARNLFASLMLRRAGGDWSPDETPGRYPPPGQVGAKRVALTFDALLSGFAQDRGWGALDARPRNRALYDRHRTLERLAAHLGHRDALRVTKANAFAWKQEMQGRGLHASTLRNDLSEMSALWRWGIANGLVPDNPFAGVSPAKAKARKRAVRPFTDQEAAALLTAARNEKGALRWLPWLACLTGARVSELAQAEKADVVTLERVVCLRIHDEGEGRSVKNADSRRSIPLHPTLLAEGFPAYVAALPNGSPLFPDLAPDKLFNRRGNTAIKRVGRWVRKAGLTDETISPNHSFRHAFIDRARSANINPEVRSALTGHSARLDESAAYGRGMKSFVRVLADAMATIEAPAVASPPHAPQQHAHDHADAQQNQGECRGEGDDPPGLPSNIAA